MYKQYGDDINIAAKGAPLGTRYINGALILDHNLINSDQSTLAPHSTTHCPTFYLYLSNTLLTLSFSYIHIMHLKAIVSLISTRHCMMNYFVFLFALHRKFCHCNLHWGWSRVLLRKLCNKLCWVIKLNVSLLFLLSSVVPKVDYSVLYMGSMGMEFFKLLGSGRGNSSKFEKLNCDIKVLLNCKGENCYKRLLDLN